MATRPRLSPTSAGTSPPTTKSRFRTGSASSRGFQVSHNGEYEGLRVADPIGVSVTNPDFTLVGAQVGLAGENWELTFNVENLLDEDYYTDVQTFPDFYFLDGDADEIITIGTLGQPRLATVSLSYFF